MKNIEIMTPDPQWIGPEETLQQAARQMKARNVGILPVLKENRLVGVLTDRDIAIRAVANGLDPDKTVVRRVMSRLILYCFADQEQEEAASMMESHHVRRLPVLDRHEHLVGIISLRDLAVRTDHEELALRVLEHLAEEPKTFRVHPTPRQAESVQAENPIAPSDRRRRDPGSTPK
jgi:CBS domain-containing protein